jgi:hypothetical protein
MAFKADMTVMSFEAGVDLSSKRYTFVSMSSDGQIDPTGDGAIALGVLQDEPAAAGRAAAVCTAGTTMITAGGTIAAGAELASDANGKAVTAATNDIILGTALKGAAADEIVQMLFHPRGAAA